MLENDQFEGEITVSSRIVDYLSSGLYENPAACLKELINNSYDADATEVRVFVKPDADLIIVEDNGTGMSREEFQRHFTRIAASHKRDDSEFTQSGRPKIGRIGIGFIAANELCDEIEIWSTQRGTRELLMVSIDFAKMRLDPAARQRDGDDLVTGDYTGKVANEASSDEHYTKLFLKKVRGETRSMLSAPRRLSLDGETLPSLYGLSPESIAEKLADPTLKDWGSFDPYSQNMLRVALNVPVQYYENWIPRTLRKKVADLEQMTADLRFSVKYDGSELRKPTVLQAREGPVILSRFEFKGENTTASGYFFANYRTIRPENLNGVLIRIRHAAVGEYDPTFLDYPASLSTLVKRWVSAEIWADDSLEDALNIDRRTLRTDHPAFAELQKHFHEDLHAFLQRVRKEVYEIQAQKKREKKVREATESFRDFVSREITPISKKAARTALEPPHATRKQKLAAAPVLRKFDVESLYTIVIDVAREVLDKKQLSLFLEKLAERLNR